jgi:signal transduction histidine kinase/ligand-binding sensor domain-containing protein
MRISLSSWANVGFQRSLAMLIVFSFFSSISARAVDPARHISQYGHKAWRIQDGFFDGAPYTIAQTADGYLWIGTANGLLRFDGVRFVPWTPPYGKQLLSSVVGRVFAARDGSLWIGTTRDGLSHWTGHDLVNYSLPANAVINPIFEEENGTVWFSRAGNPDETGPLCQVNGRAKRCYGKADGIPEDRYSAAERDSAGNFWLGGETGLTRWRPGSSQRYYESVLKSNAGQLGVAAIAFRPDGSLWVGMNHSGPGLGLQQFSEGVSKPLVVPGFDSSTLRVHSLLVDHQNAVWVGTIGQGVYRIYGENVDHFGSSDGLSGDVIYRFLEDREGNLWVVTDKGLDCFRDLPIVTFSTREGLTTSTVNSVQAMRGGAIWIGGDNGLDILSPGVDQDRVRPLQTEKGLRGTQTTSLFEDHAGRHWVGIDNTLNIYENGRFTRIARRDGTPTGVIYGIAEDINNNLWILSVGPPKVLIRIFDLKVQEEVPTPQIPAPSSLVADPRGGVWLGLLSGDLARYQQGRAETFLFDHPPHSRVNQVLLSSDGSLLAATSYGLIRWSNGKQQILSARNGLPCDAVNGLVEDGSGAAWLYMQCGLVEVGRSDLQRWWAKPDVSLQPTVFDVFDGAQPNRPAPFESGAVRTLDGRLWFVSGSAMQMINPAHLARNLIAPPVHVEQVIADRKSYSPQGNVRLPARTRDVEINYTALSFAVPQRVRFRYRLEGRDSDWQDPGTRRQAFYTDLRPRSYRFHVIACNNDGVWNEAGATLDFAILPAYYQTAWFRAICASGFLLLLWIAYRLRVRGLRRQFAAGLEARLDERTRIARDLHDTFLQTIQGSKLVADAALKQSTDPSRMRGALGQLSIWLERATEEGRAALDSLRTSTTEGNDLAEAFRRAIEECRIETSMESSFSVVGEARKMHPIVRDEVYRIGYEAIRNACVHSQASKLQVTLSYREELGVCVVDNGVGMDTLVADHGKDGHFGLKGMRERASRIAGKLSVTSSPASGTEVKLAVPGKIIYRKMTSDPEV